MHDFLHCIDDDPWGLSDRGAFEVRLSIAESGTVDSACIQHSTLVDGRLLDCMRAETLTLRFPKGPQSVASFPFSVRDHKRENVPPRQSTSP
jgi:hypothetical protein